MHSIATTLPIWVKEARTVRDLLIHMKQHNTHLNGKIHIPTRTVQFFLTELLDSLGSDAPYTGSLSISGQLPTAVEKASTFRDVALAIKSDLDAGKSSIPMKFWTYFLDYMENGTPAGGAPEIAALIVELENLTATGANGIGSMNSSKGYPSGRTNAPWSLINAWYNWNDSI